MVLGFQSYSQFFVREGSLWSISETGTDGLQIPDYYWFKFQGDSTINGITYAKAYKSNDPTQVHWWPVDLYREDEQGRVYRFCPNDKEIMYYNFGLQVGDSIPFFDTFLMYVDSVVVKPFGVGSDERKHIYASHGSNVKQVWIEGVGGLRGPQFSGMAEFLMLGIIPELTCFYEQGELVYHSQEYSTCFPVSTSLLPSNRSRLRVNLSDGLVHFRAEGVATHGAHFRVVNPLGREVYAMRLNGQLEWKVPMGSHPPGVYIYSLGGGTAVVAGRFYKP